MLGEKIGEATGKVTNRRVLPSESGMPTVEVSFQATAKLYGIDVMEMGTYRSVMKPGGGIYGEGQGLIVTTDGDAATWRGAGVGKPTGKGMSVSYRGAVYYETTSPKLSRLNNLCAVFDYEVDDAGNTHSILSEWK